MAEEEGGKRIGQKKEFTVDDFFPDKPEPAVSFKQFKDNLKNKLRTLENNE